MSFSSMYEGHKSITHFLTDLIFLVCPIHLPSVEEGLPVVQWLQLHVQRVWAVEMFDDLLLNCYEIFLLDD